MERYINNIEFALERIRYYYWSYYSRMKEPSSIACWRAGGYPQSRDTDTNELEKIAEYKKDIKECYEQILKIYDGPRKQRIIEIMKIIVDSDYGHPKKDLYNWQIYELFEETQRILNGTQERYEIIEKEYKPIIEKCNELSEYDKYRISYIIKDLVLCRLNGEEEKQYLIDKMYRIINGTQKLYEEACFKVEDLKREREEYYKIAILHRLILQAKINKYEKIKQNLTPSIKKK